MANATVFSSLRSSVANLSKIETIIAVVRAADHALTTGEVISAVQSIRNDISPGTIRKYLSRMSQSDKYPISRKKIGRRHFLYFFNDETSKDKSETSAKKIPFELREFFDPKKELYIHNIQMIARNVPIKKTEERFYSFLDYQEKIRVKFNASTGSIQIFFKCGNWKRGLNYYRFLSFAEKIRTILQERNLEKYYDKVYFIQCHINQDDETIRLNETNFISLKGFANQILVLYNKGDGTRREEQHVFKQELIGFAPALALLRNHVDMQKIATAFDEFNITSRALDITISTFNRQSQLVLKDLFTQANYGYNVIQGLDDRLCDYDKNLKEIQNGLSNIRSETLDIKDIIASSLQSIEKNTSINAEASWLTASTLAAMREENKEDFDRLELQIAQISENTTKHYNLISQQITEYEKDSNWFHVELQNQLNNINYKVSTWKQREKFSYMAQQLKQLLEELGPLSSKQICDSLNISPGRVSQLIAELGKLIVWEDVKTGRRGRPKRIFRLKKVKEGDEIES